jgi:hypothetical protein
MMLINEKINPNLEVKLEIIKTVVLKFDVEKCSQYAQ